MTRRRDKRNLPGRLVTVLLCLGDPRLQNVPQVYLLLNRNLRHYILGKPLLSSILRVFIHCNIVFL